MKLALVFLAVIAVAFAAPQPKKIFHENFEEFLDLIQEEAGHDIEHVLEHYAEFEEFGATIEYMRTANFKDLVYEMEDLPEFKAVLDFFETHSIDITYFIDRFNDMIEEDRKVKAVRHTLSGTDFTAFIRDTIAEFPKGKLDALFDEKIAEDDEFRAAVESVNSDEWKEILDALWANEEYLNEVKSLSENGIEIKVILDELIPAVFGQN